MKAQNKERNTMKQHNPENGSVLFNAVMITLLVAIGVLSYMLITDRKQNTDVTVIGNASPTALAINTDDQPNRAQEVAKSDSDAADHAFNDGMGTPDSRTTYPTDDFGEGVSARDVFWSDINNDGTPDRITRTTISSGTAHGAVQYKIEIVSDGKFIDITPPDFNTVEGADCALRKLRITLTPRFHAVRISRPLGETWDAPTVPVKEIFSVQNNRIVRTGKVKMAPVCDVSTLF